MIPPIRFAGTLNAIASAFGFSPASRSRSCSTSPGWIGGNRFALFTLISLLLVRIHDLHIVGVTVAPFKADPELIVDPDAVLVFAVSLESF